MKHRSVIRGLLVACLMLFSLSSCNGHKGEVEHIVGQMMSAPIALPLERMECKQARGERDGAIYKMMVYVDSAQCTPCALDHLRFWNKLIKEAREKICSVDYLFILAPKPREMADVLMELEVAELQGSVYLDTAYTFKKSNVHIPGEKQYHSFLLDKDNRVVLVGSPIDNEKVKEIYQRTILSK